MSSAVYRIGSRAFDVSTTNGTVAQADKRSETHVSGSIGSSYDPITQSQAARGSISSTTVVHDDLFLIDEQGKEHVVRAWGLDLACRAGHRLSVTWLRDQSKPDGKRTMVRIHNHDTGLVSTAPKALIPVLRPKPLRWWLAFLVIVLLLPSVMGAGNGLFTVFVLLVGMAIAYSVVAKGRVKRLFAEFDFSAVEAVATPQPTVSRSQGIAAS